jgi:quinol monooxygenase YgiN
MIGQTVKEVVVAVVYIQEFPIADRTTTNYDFMADKIGDGPFDGLIVHTAGYDDDDGVFRIVDVWESREHAERFLAEHVQPMIEQGPQAFPNPDAFTMPTRDGFYELHHVVR